MHQLPNLISLLRLALVPAVLYALIHGAYLLATWLFVAAGASDALDGWLARRFRWSSAAGAWLDAVADKLMVATTLIALAWLGKLPPWLAGLLFARDVLMFLAVLVYRHLAGAVRIAPLLIGKMHVAVVFAMLVAVLADASEMLDLRALLSWVFGLAIVTAFASLALYFKVWGGRLQSRAVRPRVGP